VSEVLAIMRLKRKVMVISWDTIVHDINIIRSKKDVDNIRLTGGGGTIIRPPLEYVNERKHFGDSVIVFSDFAIGDLNDKHVQKYLSKTLNFTTAVEPDVLRKEYGIKAVKIKVK
jgi:predicted metal-dependent peptidase